MEEITICRRIGDEVRGENSLDGRRVALPSPVPAQYTSGVREPRRRPGLIPDAAVFGSMNSSQRLIDRPRTAVRRVPLHQPESYSQRTVGAREEREVARLADSILTAGRESRADDQKPGLQPGVHAKATFGGATKAVRMVSKLREGRGEEAAASSLIRAAVLRRGWAAGHFKPGDHEEYITSLSSGLDSNNRALLAGIEGTSYPLSMPGETLAGRRGQSESKGGSQ